MSDATLLKSWAGVSMHLPLLFLIKYLLRRTLRALLLSTGIFPGGRYVWNLVINNPRFE
jgi:hypothetical protein